MDEVVFSFFFGFLPSKLVAFRFDIPIEKGYYNSLSIYLDLEVVKNYVNKKI